jgi:proline dehydrogenase
MRRAWQAGMIALARSPGTRRWMQQGRAASGLAGRYVAGTDAEAGVVRAASLLGQGIGSSLYYLGEYVDSPALVAENVAQKLGVAGRLGRAGLEIHVSVDPTQIGHSLDPALGHSNALAIARAIADAPGPGPRLMMIDMEDRSFVDATIALHDELRGLGLPVGITLQAYLRRTEADLQARIRQGAAVRLVKGAFTAGRDVAFGPQAEIKQNHRRLIETMLSRQARDAGFRPVIATHDDALQDHAIAQAEANGWRKDEYEFEMLLGVRGALAERRAREGHRMRLYLPFGRDWWPYAIRRIGENPRNGWLLARSLLGG